MVGHICTSGLGRGGANASDTKAAFLDLHLSVFGGFVSIGIYDKQDAFDFEIVSFPFLDGGVPGSVRPTGVYLLYFFCSGIQFYVLLSPCLRFFYLSFICSRR